MNLEKNPSDQNDIGLNAKEEFHRSLLLQDGRGIGGVANTFSDLGTESRIGLPYPHHLQHESPSGPSAGKFLSNTAKF